MRRSPLAVRAAQASSTPPMLCCGWRITSPVVRLIFMTPVNNTYSFRDVGAEHLQVQPDGTEILMLIGQIPFGVDSSQNEALCRRAKHHSETSSKPRM